LFTQFEFLETELNEHYLTFSEKFYDENRIFNNLTDDMNYNTTILSYFGADLREGKLAFARPFFSLVPF